jgi:lysophospholipase L1-like esterase
MIKRSFLILPLGLAVLTCFLLTGSLLTACRTGVSTDNPEVLKQLVIDYFDAVANKRFEKLNAVTTPDFVIYENGKIWNNDSVFKNIRYHVPFTAKFALTDFKINMDSRSGDVTYLSHVDFVFADTIMVAIDFVEGATFRKTSSGWKINLLYATLKQPAVVNKPSLFMRYDTIRYIKGHYKERVGVFESEAMTKGGTIFLGNSITEFGEWKSLLGDSAVINRGIAGDNTFGLLDRLDEVIARRPDKLYIEAGINDIAQHVPIGMICGNISAIAEIVKTKSPGTKVYVISILPTNEDAKKEYPEVYGNNTVAEAVNSKLKENAGKEGFTFIDLAASVKDSTGNLDRKYALPDGLHPNKAGYLVLVNLLRDPK